MRLRGALFLTLAVALIAPGAAAAKDIHVHPGDGLQKVVDNASPGDVLRIHGGHYNPTGGLTIDKRLTLVGYNARPRIRGSCGTTYTVRARHNRVVLNHLKVVGANYADVDYRDDIEGGKVKDLKLEDKCEGVEYGVNVFDAGAMEVVDNIASGYEDAGIYVGAIADTGGMTLSVHDNEVLGNNRGILIEDSNADEQDIAVTSNNAHDNNLPGVGGTNTGIFLTNSVGVLVSANISSNNGTYGFELVSNSDDNTFNSNTASGNGTAAFFADGSSTGNCQTFANTGFTLPAC